MLWNDLKTPYIAVKEPDGYKGKVKETSWSVWPTWESWTWPGWEGKPIAVEVYTKQDKVSLFLNGTLVETKAVGRNTQYKAVFTLPYQQGTLKAVTADGASTELATAGPAARLRLSADRRVIAANGQDLAYITIEVVDSEGRVVPHAELPCQVALSGRGQILAAASADLTDLEPMASPRVTTWKGRAIVVVRSAARGGKARITVTSQLPAATIDILQK